LLSEETILACTISQNRITTNLHLSIIVKEIN